MPTKEKLPLYSAQYIGVLDQQSFGLACWLLSPSGLDRISALYYRPDILTRANIQHLTELGRVIHQQVNPLGFIEHPNIVMETLHQSNLSFWFRFCLAVTRTAGENFLKTSGELGGRVFVTEDAIRNSAPETNRKPFFIPEAAALRLFQSTAQVEDLYFFRITNRPILMDLQGTAFQLRETLANLQSRQALQLALRSFVDRPRPVIKLPDPENLSLTLVSSRYINLSEEQELKLNGVFSRTLSMGIPSIEKVAYFALNLMTDKIPQQPNSREYFRQVENHTPFKDKIKAIKKI